MFVFDRPVFNVYNLAMLTTKKSEIDKTLKRGVEQILPSKEGLAKLMLKQKISLYQGFDPSTPSLHIGHLIGIRKLAQFQKLGHKIIFLIGDGTGQAGDPSGKSKTRSKFLTNKELRKNAEGYKEQVGRVIKFDGENPAKLLYNSAWLNKLNLVDILNIAQNFSVQNIIERKTFQKRLKEGSTINLREFLYPLLQGYDTVVMDVNLEIGGNDQLFNMMAGRTLMKNIKGKEKYVLTLKLLEDITGKKMGKTEGNIINLTDSAQDLFGKIMALPDSFIERGIELLTDLPINITRKENPMNTKKLLAFEVVKQIKGINEATSAKSSFEKTFQKKAPRYEKNIKIEDTLSDTISQVVSSKTEAKRLILQGAVDVNGKTVINPILKINIGDKIQIGKKTFIRIIKK